MPGAARGLICRSRLLEVVGDLDDKTCAVYSSPPRFPVESFEVVADHVDRRRGLASSTLLIASENEPHCFVLRESSRLPARVRRYMRLRLPSTTTQSLVSQLSASNR